MGRDQLNLYITIVELIYF